MLKRFFSWFKKHRFKQARPSKGRPLRQSDAVSGIHVRHPVPKNAEPWVKAAARLGIDPTLSPDQIREQLATMYRRFNRAAASLSAEVREESEEMLDLIIEVRKGLPGRG